MLPCAAPEKTVRMVKLWQRWRRLATRPPHDRATSSGWGETKTWVIWTLSSEWVAYLNSLELPKVSVMRPDRAHLVFAHQGDDVRIRHQVACRSHIGGYRQVLIPEPLLLAGDPEVRQFEELRHIGLRLRGRQRRPGDNRVSRDAQVCHHDRPEQVHEIWPGRETLDQNLSGLVEGAVPVGGVDKEVRVDRRSGHSSMARRTASLSSRSTRKPMFFEIQWNSRGCVRSPCASGPTSSSETRRPRLFPSRLLRRFRSRSTVGSRSSVVRVMMRDDQSVRI